MMSEVLLSCQNCGSEFYRRKAEVNRQKQKKASVYCSRQCSGIGRSGSIEDVFKSYTEDPETSCWNWIGCKNKDGYGVTSLQGESVLAHRRAWAATHGEIKGEKHVCHRCDNPACINPKHLFLGTHQDNMNDMRRKGRGFSKLSASDIKTIQADTRPCNDIANDFGVSPRTIRYHKPLPPPPEENSK